MNRKLCKAERRAQMAADVFFHSPLPYFEHSQRNANS